MEDMLEVLEWVAHVLPASMEAYPAEFISFVIVFLGSADHIRNAHLRARLVDVSGPGLAPAYDIDACAGLKQMDDMLGVPDSGPRHHERAVKLFMRQNMLELLRA